MPFLKSVTIFFILRNEIPSVSTAILKCLPVINLIIFTWTTMSEYSTRPNFSKKILFALIFCCLGDLLLVWPSYFVAGMIMFALGHITYASAFGFTPLNAVLGAVLQLGGFFTSFMLMPKLNGILSIGVPIYVIILIIMSWRAMSRISCCKTTWSWTAVSSWLGGLCFLISDTVLGFHNFHNPLYYGHVTIMATYYIAQLGLTLSSINTI